MDQSEIKLVIEAALLAAGRPLPLDKIVELFKVRGDGLERSTIREALDALATDYEQRGIELKEVSSGFRIQVRASMNEWLQPLWEERAPRYTRALLETLALIAYRQPITRGEIEEVRGVAVSSNIVRTLMERGWVRVVGHREVPGKPAMLGTTREFLDYFGLKRLEDLPMLADLGDEFPQSSPQNDFIDSLSEAVAADGGIEDAEGAVVASAAHGDDAVPDGGGDAEAAAADEAGQAPESDATANDALDEPAAAVAADELAAPLETQDEVDGDAVAAEAGEDPVGDEPPAGQTGADATDEAAPAATDDEDEPHADQDPLPRSESSGF